MIDGLVCQLASGKERQAGMLAHEEPPWEKAGYRNSS